MWVKGEVNKAVVQHKRRSLLKKEVVLLSK